MPALAERPRSPISPAEAHASFIPVEDIRPITNVELPAEMAALVFGGIQPTEAVKHRLWETGSEAEAIRDLAGATAGVAVRGIEEIANMSQEVGETLIQHPTRTAATALTLSALLLAACAPQAQGNQDSQRYLPYIEKGDGSSAQTPATPQPTDTPRVVISPTFEAQPTATPPPEVQKEQQLIIPKEFLSQGKLIEWTDPADQSTYLFVAFNLPSGTPLFAGATGKLDKSVEGGTPFVGRRASIIDRSVSPPVVIDVRGADMEFEGGMVPASVPAEKGQKFGKVGATGKKHAGPFAEFNTLVHLDTKDPATGKFGPAKRAYPNQFPGLDLTQTQKVVYNGEVKPSFGFKFPEAENK